MVLHEEYWRAFFEEEKKVEFRVSTTLVAGMHLLLSMGAAHRRSGKTGLLLATVKEVFTLPIKEACCRFPKEAEACNLLGRWRRSTVACIVVGNIRLAPEYALLGPGNLGCLRQFSVESCRPQFCHVEDLGRAVTVVHKGHAVKRTICNSPGVGAKGNVGQGRQATFSQSNQSQNEALIDATGKERRKILAQAAEEEQRDSGTTSSSAVEADVSREMG